MFVDIMSGLTMLAAFGTVGANYWLRRRKLCTCGHVRSEHRYGVVQQPEELKALVPETYWYGECCAKQRYRYYKNGGSRNGWQWRNCACQKFDPLLSR